MNSCGSLESAPAETSAPGKERLRQLVPGLPPRAFDVLALYSFVVLGLPDGALGTAWPTVRKSFGAPLAYLGVVLLVGTAGSVASSSVAGTLFKRLGAGRTVMAAAVVGLLGALGVALSTTFAAFSASGGLIGVSAGLLDSTVNTSVAMTGRNRLLNMVHGAYGVGTSLAPLVVTACVLAGSWRGSYAVVGACELALAGGWWVAARRFSSARAMWAPGAPDVLAPHAGGQSPGAPGGAGGRGSGRPAEAPGPKRSLWPLVCLGLMVFMVYTGLEVSAGQWSPSFERSVLHMGPSATGLATFGYWGSLTLARFGLAVPRRPAAPLYVVRWGCMLALAGALLVWWRPVVTVALVGLVVVGGALAGVFPALVALTPARVGAGLAHHVIGWQIGAASVGGSVISALCGVAFQHWGLGELGPALAATAAVLVGTNLVLEKVAR